MTLNAPRFRKDLVLQACANGQRLYVVKGQKTTLSSKVLL